MFSFSIPPLFAGYLKDQFQLDRSAERKTRDSVLHAARMLYQAVVLQLQPPSLVLLPFLWLS
jgi:hypothetical protein